jgi:hypothetical protein
MKWTGTITNKDIIDGELTIQIAYRSEDNRTLNDSATTRGGQDDLWATNIVARKVKELEELDNFITTIPIGEVKVETVVDNTVVSKVNSNTTVSNPMKETFRKDYNTYLKMIEAIRKNIMPETHKDFVAMKKKLTDNLKVEYLDIL